ncbi:hypothetical protein LP316_04955 [Thalassotalea sp. LPB0316]|uniref:hypothetical protein n=1 Tax=Thalassotalea sp. LPB0316 TaxID=2769490 RepID=UPI001867154A|nr:hypothetical protein [Thalassotalea sp. LPB0316]QOL26652.1 hypothetical protein LP316_04955 [Thalassotalea sp. LPB0316]
MKHVFLISTLIFSSSSFAFSLDSQQEVQAFACEDCNEIAARSIAVANAPSNSCNIFRNGRSASYCEPIAKQILIPVHKTRDIFKFIVTTQIDAQNRPYVTARSFPITPNQSEVMHQYLEFNDDLMVAISEANISSSELFPKPDFVMSKSAQGTGSNDSTCDSHPTAFLSSPENQQAISSDIGNKLSTAFRGNTAADLTHERLTSGGGISLGQGAAGIDISFSYLNRNLLVFRGDDFDNRLAFNVHLGSDPLRDNHVVFSLELNKGWTKIDGFKYGELFGGGAIDLSGVLVSNCLIDFLTKEGDSGNEPPTTGGGTGSLSDPFYGFDALNNNDPLNFCRYNKTVKTCSTTEDGNTSCTSSRITWINKCGLVN